MDSVNYNNKNDLNETDKILEINDNEDEKKYLLDHLNYLEVDLNLINKKEELNYLKFSHGNSNI